MVPDESPVPQPDPISAKSLSAVDQLLSLVQQRTSECERLVEICRTIQAQLETERGKAIQASAETLAERDKAIAAGLAVADAMNAARLERDRPIAVNQEVDAAKSATEAARERAVTASTEAEAAKVLTETHRDNARRASDEASVAKSAAEAARDDAAAASRQAASEKANAESAHEGVKNTAAALAVLRVSIEAERDNASKASADAATAKVIAESERDQAVNAKAAANEAMTSARAESEQAVQAKATAVAASASAESERDRSIQAQTAASAAKVAAEAERDSAAQATSAANSAKTAAESELEQAKAAHSGAVVARVAAETERDNANEAFRKADSAKAEAETARNRAVDAASKAETEAKRALEAHHLSTTTGLAGAFNEKALQAKKRGNLWLGALAASLVWASVIGYLRYEDLRALLTTKPPLDFVIAEMLLGLFGVGAPVWLAWISTRMISKTFSIAEDYSYKASLAKAYVGFREEARDLDPLLQQRLFAAAITQLDANPVRFLDSAHPGSPLQDLLQQPFMQEVLEDVTVKQALINWFNSKFNSKLILVPRTEIPKKDVSEVPKG